jgi:hypothetical protein
MKSWPKVFKTPGFLNLPLVAHRTPPPPLASFRIDTQLSSCKGDGVGVQGVEWDGYKKEVWGPGKRPCLSSWTLGAHGLWEEATHAPLCCNQNEGGFSRSLAGQG